MPFSSNQPNRPRPKRWDEHYSHQEDAERRYFDMRKRQKSQKGRKAGNTAHARTWTDFRAEAYLSFAKSKTVKDSLKQWWFFKRMVHMSEKQKHETILHLTVGCHYLFNYNRTAKELRMGLYKVFVMVVVPFMAPPAIIFGIPALALLLPLVLFAWVISVLNRRAKAIMEHHRRARPGLRKQGMASRLSRFAFGIRQSTMTDVTEAAKLAAELDAEEDDDEGASQPPALASITSSQASSASIKSSLPPSSSASRRVPSSIKTTTTTATSSLQTTANSNTKTCGRRKSWFFARRPSASKTKASSVSFAPPRRKAL